ncbi:MAG: hypothetical protein FMNOHCHN_01541 [Ignavibacteriaceae bacterium]|nr:hypothetical protein [Ignavibacteriaceae bacterium]
MKSFEVICKSGHLIDPQTGKRVILMEDHKYTIAGAESSFRAPNEQDIDKILKNSGQKNVRTEKVDADRFKKLLSAGSKLHFQISGVKRGGKEFFPAYSFICIILEDLYVYLKKDRKNESYTDWALSPCKCRLEECMSGGLMITDYLLSNSLNSLFSHTVQYYFPNQRSGSANVFETFSLIEERPGTGLFSGTSTEIRINEKLAILREKVSREYGKPSGAEK